MNYKLSYAYKMCYDKWWIRNFLMLLFWDFFVKCKIIREENHLELKLAKDPQKYKRAALKKIDNLIC